jgi:hypothetical protein
LTPNHATPGTPAVNSAIGFRRTFRAGVANLQPALGSPTKDGFVKLFGADALDGFRLRKLAVA